MYSDELADLVAFRSRGRFAPSLLFFAAVSVLPSETHGPNGKTRLPSPWEPLTTRAFEPNIRPTSRAHSTTHTARYSVFANAGCGGTLTS